MTKESRAYKFGISRFGDEAMSPVTKMIDNGYFGLAESLYWKSILIPYIVTNETAAGFKPIEIEGED